MEVLDDVLKIKPPREYPLETAHLGTLFIMDKDKDGKFSVHDLIDFATLYHERQARQDVVDFLVINFKFIQNYYEFITHFNVLNNAYIIGISPIYTLKIPSD